MEAILEKFYYNEIFFRLKNSGWSVSVAFGPTMWVYSTIHYGGSTLLIDVPLYRSTSVLKILDVIDNYHKSPIRFPLLLLASAHSHQIVKREWWGDKIPYLPDEPPLKCHYTIHRDNLAPSFVEDFNTEYFFKSLYRSLGKRKVEAWEANNINFAIKLLEKANAFEGSDVIRELAYKVLSKAISEVLKDEKE